jgi:anti-sigma28 factor (negative regulator of flagellin synthesis)
MQIRKEQIDALRKAQEEGISQQKADAATIKLLDQELIAATVQRIEAAPDREDRIAELKARIAAGEYMVTGEEIADAMIRRAAADRAVVE